MIVFRRPRLSRRLSRLRGVIVVVAALVLVACGQQPAPTQLPALPALQSPIQTPQLPGNVTVAAQATVPQTTPSPTTTPALVPTVVRTPFVSQGDGTPDTRATSQAVILTITALAQPATRRPTTVPPRPIGAGGRGRVTQVPTPTLDPSGISLLSVSKTVYRGGAVTVSVRTKPGAQCTLGATQVGADGASVDLPIPNPAHLAGSDGAIAWIWPIDAGVPTGATALRVDCGTAGSAQYGVEIKE